MKPTSYDVIKKKAKEWDIVTNIYKTFIYLWLDWHSSRTSCTDQCVDPYTCHHLIQTSSVRPWWLHISQLPLVQRKLPEYSAYCPVCHAAFGDGYFSCFGNGRGKKPSWTSLGQKHLNFCKRNLYIIIAYHILFLSNKKNN